MTSIHAPGVLPVCRYYSGLGKTLPMMLWAQEEAAIRFTLPDLPHLSESDRVLYKEQVRSIIVHARPVLLQDWLARVETGINNIVYMLCTQVYEREMQRRGEGV